MSQAHINSRVVLCDIFIRVRVRAHNSTHGTQAHRHSSYSKRLEITRLLFCVFDSFYITGVWCICIFANGVNFKFEFIYIRCCYCWIAGSDQQHKHNAHCLMYVSAIIKKRLWIYSCHCMSVYTIYVSIHAAQISTQFNVYVMCF